jgi:hypothetical protein
MESKTVNTEKKWHNPTNRGEIEIALDSGNLYIAVANGAWYQARRNGKTQTWKTNPDRFRIPVRFGFRGTTGIDSENTNYTFLRIANSREDAEAKI